MMQIIIILLILAVAVHDSFVFFPLHRIDDHVAVVILTLGPIACALLVCQVVVWRCARSIDRTAEVRFVRRADLAAQMTRGVIVAATFAGVLGVGWLDRVRGVTGGDRVLVDELLALVPAVLALIAVQMMMYPIDRRIHEGSRGEEALDGTYMPPMPGRLGSTWDYVRHQMLIVLVPIVLITGWAESVAWLAREKEAAWGIDPQGVWVGIAQFAGVAMVLAVSPLIIRFLWSTEPLAEGPLRDRLEHLCKIQRVRCAQILRWRTRGLMLNGAVIGLTRRLRYILLTDALLERMSDAELEAVMAHEVAHARYRHLPWLMIAMVVCATGAWFIAWWLGLRVFGLLGYDTSQSSVDQVAAASAMPAALVAGFFLFGFVSRRFEWQADAFAAKHLSGASRRDARVDISHEGASTMADALRRVAKLNHIPLDRFGWRHGRIRDRIERLYALIGNDGSRLKIDRQVLIIKIACGLALLGLIVLTVLGYR